MAPAATSSSPTSFDLAVEPRPVRAAGRARRWRLPWIRLGLVGTAAACALPYFTKPPREAPRLVIDSPEPELSAPPAPWRMLEGAVPSYALVLPASADRPVAFEARRSRSGAREDIFDAGAFAVPSSPVLRLGLTRFAESPKPASSFFVDLVRQAAQAGLGVVRSGLPAAVATKFGAVEVADVVLAGARERACLGFRFLHPQIGFRLSGWACGTDTDIVDRSRLACLIDGIRLAPGTADGPLDVLFAEAEGQRGETCPVPRATAGRAGSRAK